MNPKILKLTSFAFITIVLIATAFTQTINSQNYSRKASATMLEDTRINPHDFTVGYYAENGMLKKMALSRRTGTDLLSVFSWSSNPIHTNVRVLATLPAYGPNGEIYFWYPLGELRDDGFIEDRSGDVAREMANANPVYVFPNRMDWITGGAEDFAFNNARQGAMLVPNNTTEFPPNALGVRIIVYVNYTDKAFTYAGQKFMHYLMDKNGLAADNTPIISNMDDMFMLMENELIVMETKFLWDDPSTRGTYALAPIIEDPTAGAIAPDAFLLMATRDGKALPAEANFLRQFNCLQQTQKWCE